MPKGGKMSLKKYQKALASLAFQTENVQPRRYIDYYRNYYDDDVHFFEVLDPFEMDAHKIINSKAFRRLQYKTQVFPTPNNSHIRTRLLHVKEVESTAVLLATILGLNVPMCRAIALGHDIGHAPFGHFGEKYLTQKSGKIFSHAINGALIAQRIERKGAGLNLCKETLQGICHHSRTQDPNLTLSQNVPEEFNVIMLADKIAYVFSDYNDAKRNNSIKEPNDSNIEFFGKRQRLRAYHCIEALVEESAEQGKIAFAQSQTAKEFKILRQWLQKNVYQPIKFDIQAIYFERLLDFFSSEKDYQDCDPYVLLSLLTDNEVFQFGEYCKTARIPTSENLANFGIKEIAPWIKGKKLDFSSPKLDW